MAAVLALPLLLASLALTACRLFTPSPQLLVQVTAFVPFALVGYLVATPLWLVGWRLSSGVPRRLALVATLVSLAGLVFHTVLLVPSYAGAHVSGEPDLTVLTSNLRLGLADTDAVTTLAERQDADVVVLEEVTPSAFDRLDELKARLPHQAGEPFAGARGTVVFSRYPLDRITQLNVFQGAWAMRVEAPKPFWLVAVHTVQPGTISLWRSDLSWVVWAAGLTTSDGPTVMAGDFNATLDHRPMRRLLGLGLSDAARQANSGWQPTWPSDPDTKHGLPFGLGLVAIDHVLVSKQFSTISTSTFHVAGSDHRALLARIAVR